MSVTAQPSSDGASAPEQGGKRRRPRKAEPSPIIACPYAHPKKPLPEVKQSGEAHRRALRVSQRRASLVYGGSLIAGIEEVRPRFPRGRRGSPRPVGAPRSVFSAARTRRVASGGSAGRRAPGRFARKSAGCRAARVARKAAPATRCGAGGASSACATCCRVRFQKSRRRPAPGACPRVLSSLSNALGSPCPGAAHEGPAAARVSASARGPRRRGGGAERDRQAAGAAAALTSGQPGGRRGQRRPGGSRWFGGGLRWFRQARVWAPAWRPRIGLGLRLWPKQVRLGRPGLRRDRHQLDRDRRLLRRRVVEQARQPTRMRRHARADTTTAQRPGSSPAVVPGGSCPRPSSFIAVNPCGPQCCDRRPGRAAPQAPSAPRQPARHLAGSRRS